MSGSRGIGRAIAVRLAADGFDVGFCFHRNEIAAKETAAEIESHGRRCHYERVDVADYVAVGEFVARVEDRLGPPYAVVACAGITRDRPLAVMDVADWDAVLRTNLDGLFHLCRATTSGLIRRGEGVLVTVSSVSGIAGNVGQANYAASKAGAHGLIRSLAKEVGRFGVRANVVAPGFIDTDMLTGMRDSARDKAERAIALGRFGAAENVADAVSFLVSDQAAYITGAVLQVDGGLTL
ncbi:3-oxoacyl-ACP reductase FabG [Actinokineospora sp.]|uniref:3-oxoacyl-ACP reductase FabG n=1 Tax=Actinokineospora sp. TaxID=1872133 RepID=UPI0040378449